jgi:hypothetical protein
MGLYNLLMVHILSLFILWYPHFLDYMHPRSANYITIMTPNSDPVPYRNYENNYNPKTFSQTKDLLCYPNIRIEDSHFPGLSSYY